MARQTDGRGHQTRALLGTAAVTGGKFDMKLSDPLLAGQSIFASEVSTGSTGGDEPPGSSDFVRVASFGNWGLVKAYFTSGFLLSEDQGSFSQSSLFLAFTLDKTWRLPGYYFPRITKGKSGKDVQEQGLRWPPVATAVSRRRERRRLSHLLRRAKTPDVNKHAAPFRRGAYLLLLLTQLHRTSSGSTYVACALMANNVPETHRR